MAIVIVIDTTRLSTVAIVVACVKFFAKEKGSEKKEFFFLEISFLVAVRKKIEIQLMKANNKNKHELIQFVFY